MTERFVWKITILEFKEHEPRSLEDEIKLFCRCLDMDPKKDKLAFEIFLHLLNASRKGKGVKTIDLTERLGVTQAAVVYHMNSFISSGVVVKQGREYSLRGHTLSETIAQVELDVYRRMRALREVAGRIDRELYDDNTQVR